MIVPPTTTGPDAFNVAPSAFVKLPPMTAKFVVFNVPASFASVLSIASMPSYVPLPTVKSPEFTRSTLANIMPPVTVMPSSFAARPELANFVVSPVTSPITK